MWLLKMQGRQKKILERFKIAKYDDKLNLATKIGHYKDKFENLKMTLLKPANHPLCILSLSIPTDF